MTGWFDHLAIVPILLPLLAGAVLMLVDDRHPATKLAINLSAGLLLLLAAALLLARTAGGEVIVYRLGNWPTPFAITASSAVAACSKAVRARAGSPPSSRSRRPSPRRA